MYFHRQVETHLKSALKHSPAALITGPRQAGKSTLLLNCLPDHEYVTLDDPIARAKAERDPLAFLADHGRPLIIDEIQYVPGLLPYLKMEIDNHRDNPGRFVLTGSQMFQLMAGVTESLAGRLSIFQLYPFSWQEIRQVHDTAKDDRAMAAQTVRGFYPQLLKDAEISPQQWYSSYITTYLERDVRNIHMVHDLFAFQDFVSLLATRAGQLLNLTEIGKECGIVSSTVRAWITILEATYIIFRLRPYFKNHTKRLVKSRKLYFVDTGLLCHLLGIDTRERFFRAAERGAIFENMVISEAMKRRSLTTGFNELSFYRTRDGHEVDLIVDKGQELFAYEIKLAKTIRPAMGQPLVRFGRDHPNAHCRLLSLCDGKFPFTEEIAATHWTETLD